MGEVTPSGPPEQRWADLEIHIASNRDVLVIRVLGRKNSAELRDQLANDGIVCYPGISGAEIGGINNSALETLLVAATDPAVIALVGANLAAYIRRNRPKKVTFNENGIKSTEGMSAREIERLMRQQAKLRERPAPEEDDQ